MCGGDYRCMVVVVVIVVLVATLKARGGMMEKQAKNLKAGLKGRHNRCHRAV